MLSTPAALDETREWKASHDKIEGFLKLFDFGTPEVELGRTTSVLFTASCRSRLIPKNPLRYAATGFFTFAARGWKDAVRLSAGFDNGADLDLQRDALKRSGFEKIIEERPRR